MTRKGLNNVDLVNKFFGMPTIHNKQVGMERLTLSELSSVLTSAMPNADLNLKGCIYNLMLIDELKVTNVIPVTTAEC